MVSMTKPQYGHGFTGLQAYLDAKCDDIHQFKIIFDVKHDLEWSVARVFVDDGYPYIRIPVGEWGEMGRFMGSRSYWW